MAVVVCILFLYIQIWCVFYLVHPIEPPSPDMLEVCIIYNLTSQTNLAYINWNVSLFIQSQSE